jgi:hypothetical protein
MRVEDLDKIYNFVSNIFFHFKSSEINFAFEMAVECCFCKFRVWIEDNYFSKIT